MGDGVVREPTCESAFLTARSNGLLTVTFGFLEITERSRLGTCPCLRASFAVDFLEGLTRLVSGLWLRICVPSDWRDE